MKKYIFFIFFFTVSYADIYLTYDQNNNPVYSDQETSNAKKIRLPAQDAGVVKFKKTKLINSHVSKKKVAKKDKKLSIIVLQPKDKETIHSGRGNINLILKLNRELQEGEKIEIWDFIDNKKKLLLVTTKLKIQLANAERGEHHLVIKITDQNKKEIVRSKKTIIYLKRPFLKIFGPKPKPGFF